MTWTSSKNYHQGLRIVPVAYTLSTIQLYSETMCWGYGKSVPLKHYQITDLLTSFLLSVTLSRTEAQLCTWQFALTHLHLLVQSFLHPHFNSSWHPLAASGRVVQHGVHGESSFALSQTHKSGDGTLGSPISDYPQIYPAWKTTLFICCSRACNVGGMFSILRLWVNNCFLASFTWLSADVRWYKRTTYLPICSISSRDIWVGARDKRRHVGVSWGILRHTAQAVFFPIP